MTAPDTNIKKQKRRHSPALIGMSIAAVVVVLVVLFVLPQDLNDEEATATESPAVETTVTDGASAADSAPADADTAEDAATTDGSAADGTATATD